MPSRRSYAAHLTLAMAVLPRLAHAQGIRGVQIDRAEFIVSTRAPGGKQTFRETNRVPLDPFACYAWQLHFSKNTLGELGWREEFTLPAKPAMWLGGDSSHSIGQNGTVSVTERRETPTDGWLYHEWCVAPGDPTGKYVITVYVQGKLAKSFEFFVAPARQERDSVAAVPPVQPHANVEARSDAPRGAPGVKWTRRSPPGEELSGIAWSGSQFAAVGWGVLTSADGLTWKVRAVPEDWRLEGITWDGSQFVAVGGAAPVPGRRVIGTSPDGVSWTERRAPGSTGWLQDVAWSGKRFVAVGDRAILTSPDGVTWTERRVPASWSLGRVTWGGSQFVAVGLHSRGAYNRVPALIVTSPDGVTWTERSAPGSPDWLRDVAWSGKQFVAVGDGAILTSPDGGTWTAQSTPATGGVYLKGVTWGGSQFVAVGPGIVLTSPDGVAWTPRSTPAHSELSDVAWSGTRFVAVGARRRGWFADYTTVLVLTSP